MPRKPDTEKPAMSGDDSSPSVAAARARKPAKPGAANANKVQSSKKPATKAAKSPVKPSPKPATPRQRRSAATEGTTKIKNPVKLPPKAQQAIDISAFQGLDARQAKFVDLWLVTYNGAQSYRDAGYKCKNDNVARVGAHKLLMKVKNHPYTLARQVELFSRTADVQNQLIATYHAASFADPRELVEYKRRCCRYCYGKDFKFQLRPSEMERRIQEYETAKAEAKKAGEEIGEFDELGGVGYDGKKTPNHDCPECDGEGVGHALFKDTSTLSPAALTLFEGVKEGKDGTEMKVASQKGYRDSLAKLFNMNVEPAVAVTLAVSDEALDELYAKAQENTERNRAAMEARREELAKIGIVS